MFDTLSSKFINVFNRLKGYGKLNEKNIEQALREVRLALLEADVHVGVVKTFLENLKQKANGVTVIQSLNPEQQFLNLVHQELVAILGGEAKTLQFTGKLPHVILLAGLQGSGKTTTAAKLGALYKKQGKKVYLVPLDVYRPAAIDQLKTLAHQIDIPCYSTEPNSKPTKVIKKAIGEAVNQYSDLVIVDTAGRLQINQEMMEELGEVHKKLDHPITLFVADAMTGQEALKVTKAFHDLLNLDGIILTKLDGDARGGAALSIQWVTKSPIYFVGMGEKVADLEAFDPKRLVDRLLDRGDLLSLVEKAKEIIDESSAKELEKKVLKNQFTLEDFRQQLKQIKKMGSVSHLMSFIPGVKQMAGKINLDQVENEVKRKEAIINSMTLKEREHPEILNGSRRLRIAKGSGTEVSDINQFMKEFMEMKKMMKKFSGEKKGMLGRMLGM